MEMKKHPEDFIVRERFRKQRISNEDEQYLWFTLKKTQWDTFRALKMISRKLRVSMKRFGYAGTKDRNAITYQRVSLWNVKREDLERVKIKDIEILDIEESNERINLGDLEGNDFEITVRDINETELKNTEKNVKKARKGIINKFDTQRFGSYRQVSHLVGKEIIRNDLEKAVMIYLTKTGDEEPEETKRARLGLKKHNDFKKALKSYPEQLGYEITLLNHLINQPSDYAGALRKLPKKLRKLFVHAYQSYLWNMIAEKVDDKEIPLIGFKTEIKNKEIEKILKKEKIDPEDFRCKSMPELASEGTERDRVVVPEDLEYKTEENVVVFKFFLPKGCYATVIVKEIFKN